MNRNRTKRSDEANKSNKEDNTKQGSRRFSWPFIVMVVVCVGTLIVLGIMEAVNNSGDHTGEVQIPYGPSALEDMEYQEAVEAFKENGFTNVQAEPLGDLITGLLTKENEVDTVTVNGSESFSSGSWVPEDTEVIISYHTFPENNEVTAEESESDIDEEYELSKLEGATLEEARERLEEMGYTATYYNETAKEDMTDNLDGMGSLAYWTVTNINADSKSKTAEVSAELDTSKAEGSSGSNTSTKETTSSGMEAIYAWQAAQAYGEQLYPYGFKLHYAMDKLAEKLEDADTWFLKAGCTYTLPTGVEAEGNCEARVTGTPDNPEITYFVVY